MFVTPNHTTPSFNDAKEEAFQDADNSKLIKRFGTAQPALTGQADLDCTFSISIYSYNSKCLYHVQALTIMLHTPIDIQ